MHKIYDGTTDTKVYTNASTKALGAVFLQKYAAAKYFHPIAYYSNKLSNA